jgi:arabinogalactan endo-1,4-beta-galactosidase
VRITIKERVTLLPLAFPAVFAALLVTCASQEQAPAATPTLESKRVLYALDQFAMGVDLSYVNQIEDHGGTYRDDSQVRDPFRIFKDHGANIVRLRLWHDPTWTRTVYGDGGARMYNNIADVEKSIRRAKAQGLAVNLDFHYSDTWADPGTQKPPAAWNQVTDRSQLATLIYQYTYNTLRELGDKGLMPEMVQLGNEINCGLFFTDTAPEFPVANCCSGQWAELGEYLNTAIKAARDASAQSSVKPQVALHVAGPENVQRWFDNLISVGRVTDFDIVGFSYYPLWHSKVSFAEISTLVSTWKDRYDKKVMVLETAYPWTLAGADDYDNIFSKQPPLPGYPFTIEGQHSFLTALTQKIVSGGGDGVMYWEPAWITSRLKDLWGTGSSWENAALFDFTGNALPSIDYMSARYTLPGR